MKLRPVLATQPMVLVALEAYLYLALGSPIPDRSMNKFDPQPGTDQLELLIIVCSAIVYI